MKNWRNKKRGSLRLINNYVEINKLKVVCEVAIVKLDEDDLRNDFAELLFFVRRLDRVYIKVFLRLKMIDLSFQILRQDLANIKEKYNNFSSFDVMLLLGLKQRLEQLKNEFVEILGMLNFNDFEKNYLLQSLNVL